MSKAKRHCAVLMSAALLFILLLAIGCQPRQAADNGGGQENTAETPVAVADWGPGSDCSVCHTGEAASEANLDSVAGLHKANAGTAQTVGCITCHNDQDALSGVHKDAAAGDANVSRLKKTKVPSETCTTADCHDSADERIAATAALDTLTDEQGKTVNPHDLPTGDGHAGINCSSCHKGHEAMDARATCLSCHHENVYECGTCHG